MASFKEWFVGKSPQPTALETELLERVGKLELANKRLEARLKKVENDLERRTTYTDRDLKKVIDWYKQELAYAIYFEKTMNNKTNNHSLTK